MPIQLYAVLIEQRNRILLQKEKRRFNKRNAKNEVNKNPLEVSKDEKASETLNESSATREKNNNQRYRTGCNAEITTRSKLRKTLKYELDTDEINVKVR